MTELIKQIKESGMIYIAGYDGEIGGFGELADFILAREREQIARVMEPLKISRAELVLEINSQPDKPNIGKKGCLRRINQSLAIADEIIGGK